MSRKRRIERVGANEHELSNQVAITNTIHTCEDSKTLIRALIEVGVSPRSDIDVDIENATHWMLKVDPNGSSVSAASAAGRLDDDIPIQEIASGFLHSGQNITTGASWSDSRIYVINTNLQLKETDLEILRRDSLENKLRVTWNI